MAVPPVLRCLDIFVYRDNDPPEDIAQIPAVATVRFYQTGATVKTPVTISAGTSGVVVNVYDKGVLALGDRLWAGGQPSAELVVHDIMATTPGQISVSNNSGAHVTLTAGMRLVPTEKTVTVYSDPKGTLAIGTSAMTQIGIGRIAVYVPEFRYDYVVEVAAFYFRVFSDAEGSYVMR